MGGLKKKKDEEVFGGGLVKRFVTGMVALPLTQARFIVSNEIPNTLTLGGQLTSNTLPALARVNAATDKALRLTWTASGSQEVQWQTISPIDMDHSQPVRVKLRASMSGNTDHPTISVVVFESIGGSNVGTVTGTLTGTIATVSVTLSSVAAPPKAWSVGLIPSAHTTDNVCVDAVWMEYSRIN